MAALSAIALSAGLYALAFPPFDQIWASWVALVPLVWILRDARPARAALIGAAWGVVATAAVIAWLVPTAHEYFARPLPWALALVASVAAASAAPQLGLMAALCAARRVAPRTLWPLLFAAAWVGAEWLRTELGMRSPWARLGDAHHQSERLRQIADLAGVYGVSFVVALGNAVLAEALRCAAAVARVRRAGAPAAGLGSSDLSASDPRASEPGGSALSVSDPGSSEPGGPDLDAPDLRAAETSEAWRPLVPASLVWLVLLVAALGYGELRRGQWRAAPPLLDVLIVQGNVEPELRWSRMRAAKVLRRYSSLTGSGLREAKTRPDLVIWPENAIQTSLRDSIYGSATLDVARRAGVPLLIGAPRSETIDERVHHYNSALFLRPDGEVAYYDKRRLLLFSERSALGGGASAGDLAAAEYSPGAAPGLFEVAGARIATLICMEALYPDLGRESARLGADLIVNLSNDGWFRGRGGARQHLAQVVFRAIENRRPLVRVTTTGISAAIGPDGQVEAQIPDGVSDTRLVQLRRGSVGLSLYARAGDWFAAGCFALCALVALPWRLFAASLGELRRRPQRPQESGPITRSIGE